MDFLTCVLICSKEVVITVEERRIYEAFAFYDLLLMQCTECISQKFMFTSSLWSQETSWELVFKIILICALLSSVLHPSWKQILHSAFHSFYG